MLTHVPYQKDSPSYLNEAGELVRPPRPGDVFINTREGREQGSILTVEDVLAAKMLSTISQGIRLVPFSVQLYSQSEVYKLTALRNTVNVITPQECPGGLWWVGLDDTATAGENECGTVIVPAYGIIGQCLPGITDFLIEKIHSSRKGF